MGVFNTSLTDETMAPPALAGSTWPTERSSVGRSGSMRSVAGLVIPGWTLKPGLGQRLSDVTRKSIGNQRSALQPTRAHLPRLEGDQSQRQTPTSSSLSVLLPCWDLFSR
ncbi:hypothetical protein Ddc_15919 [Ditylenchus destructor]|nr:hypothetical protein Ddc_15919 [Ditylenchus destructor]